MPTALGDGLVLAFSALPLLACLALMVGAGFLSRKGRAARRMPRR